MVVTDFWDCERQLPLAIPKIGIFNNFLVHPFS